MFEFALKKKNLYRRLKEKDQKSIIDENESTIKNKYEIEKLIDR